MAVEGTSLKICFVAPMNHNSSRLKNNYHEDTEEDILLTNVQGQAIMCNYGAGARA
jgi:hypothetical protein